MPAFCFNEEIEKPVGTLAVKNPSRLYKRNVFKKANEPGEAKIYRFEPGWGCVLPDYRKRGIFSQLSGKLLNGYTDRNLFAATGIDNQAVQRMLNNHGFQKCGQPYQGRKELKQLYVKRVNDGEGFISRFSDVWYAFKGRIGNQAAK